MDSSTKAAEQVEEEEEEELLFEDIDTSLAITAQTAPVLAKGFISRILELDARVWSNEWSKKDIRIAKLVQDDSPFVLIRANGFVDASPDQVFDWVKGLDNLATVDPMFKEETGETLETFSEGLHVYYGVWQMPIFCTNRDFVYLEHDTTLPNNEGRLIVSRSVLHDSKPEAKGLVRGDIMDTGYVIRKEKEGTRLSYIVCANPRGWLPVSVVNLVAADQALNVQRVIEHFRK